MDNILETVEQFIDQQHLLLADSPVVLAVSGGADSIALMHIFTELRRAGKIQNELIIAHINHHLRGDLADRDEAFVMAQARKMNLNAVSVSINVSHYARQHKLSIETAARQLRRQELITVAQKYGARAIATAHHKNDNAETLVHRMLRGTGYRGLAGIEPKKQFDQIEFIRPLLCLRRDEILEYLSRRNLTFVHDHTNDEIIYTRNFIRHKLLPSLQKESKTDLVEALDDLAMHSRNLSRILTQRLDSAWPDLVLSRSDNSLELHLQSLQQLPYPLLMEAICRTLISIGCGQQDLTYDHFQNIARGILESKRTRIALPDKSIAIIASTVTFVREKIIATDLQDIVLPVPGTSQFGGFNISTRVLDAKDCSLAEFRKTKTNMTEWFDLDKITQPLTVRARRDGDSFWPIGMKTQKKVGQFLSDSKLPHLQRTAAFVISDAEEIIWLAPLRPSDVSKITTDTRNVLEIRICPCKSSQ